MKHPKEVARVTNRQGENLRNKTLKKMAAIVNRLEECAMGKVKMTREELNAAGKLMEMTMPKLQAVEHTTYSETDGMNEQQLLAMLTDLIKKDPDILSYIEKLSHIGESTTRQ